MRRRPTNSLIAAILLVVPGCVAGRGQSPTIEGNRITLKDGGGDALMETAKDVLRFNGFELDRTDARAGVVTSIPEPGAHFFEFWRGDFADAGGLWESTLNPIRRRAVVMLRHADSQWELSVEVQKQRLSRPENAFNNSAAIFEFFSADQPRRSPELGMTGGSPNWIDIGTDDALASALLNKIIQESQRRGLDIVSRSVEGVGSFVRDESGDANESEAIAN